MVPMRSAVADIREERLTRMSKRCGEDGELGTLSLHQRWKSKMIIYALLIKRG